MKRLKRRILSVSKPSVKPFRFFDLPQEIRDKIYDYLDPPRALESATVISWPLVKGPTHTRAPDQEFQRAHVEHSKTLPLKKYLLISRRFRDEILNHCLLDAWLVMKFFVDADRPPVINDRVLSRTIAKHVRNCRIQFAYRNLLGKLMPGHSPAQRRRREEKISFHLGIALNTILRQMPLLEVCHYQLNNNFDFKFTIEHDNVLSACAHWMTYSFLREVTFVAKTKKTFVEIMERQNSEEQSPVLSLKKSYQ